MIVVDTNVIAYLLIPGDRTAAADEIYRRDPNWVAPTLWRHELINVLCLYVRKGLLSVDAAADLERRAHEVIRSHLPSNASTHPGTIPSNRLFGLRLRVCGAGARDEPSSGHG